VHPSDGHERGKQNRFDFAFEFNRDKHGKDFDKFERNLGFVNFNDDFIRPELQLQFS